MRCYTHMKTAPSLWSCKYLSHCGRVTHICVSKLTIIGSDNGLSPGRRQAIIWTNAGILLIGPLGTNFSEISIDIQMFSFKKIHFKMSSGKWRPSCLGLNVLRSFDGIGWGDFGVGEQCWKLSLVVIDHSTWRPLEIYNIKALSGSVRFIDIHLL